MSTQPTWMLTLDGSASTLRLGGDWVSRTTGVRSSDEIQHLLDQVGTQTLRVDCRKLGQWDSALIAFLRSVRDAGHLHHGMRLEEEDLPKPVRRLLALAPAFHRPPTAERGATFKSLARRVGNQALKACSATSAAAALVGGTALQGAAGLTGRTSTRLTDVLHLMRQGGSQALPIVAIVNVLVGAILAFIGAVQFRKFGAGIYVADLVGIAVVREMAAVMTAIVMAGRTGGAYAAQIATMQGNEEIDALKTFGIPVFDFLVMPRILALVAMLPVLYVYGCAMGLLGGFLVGVATLDVTASAFLVELQHALAPRQFAIGLFKSVTFGALSAWASCHIGLTAGRSAADVGRAATAAVVAGIIGVIALDAAFAACTNALGL
jgi:phospholipid/cholesterol/gamma-HCH transport system permease protein